MCRYACVRERERERARKGRGRGEELSAVSIFARLPRLPRRSEKPSLCDRQISRVFLKERGPGGWNAGAASHGARPGGARCTAWIYARTYPHANTYSVNLSGAHTWRRRSRPPTADDHHRFATSAAALIRVRRRIKRKREKKSKNHARPPAETRDEHGIPARGRWNGIDYAKRGYKCNNERDRERERRERVKSISDSTKNVVGTRLSVKRLIRQRYLEGRDAFLFVIAAPC